MAGSKQLAATIACLAAAFAATAAPGKAEPSASPASPPPPLVLYSEDACPPSSENEVVVCRRRLTEEGVRALRGVASCLVERQPVAARALMAMNPGSEEYRGAMRRLVETPRECAPQRRLGFSSLLLAGALAEALLHVEARDAGFAARLRIDPVRPIRARDETEYMSLCVAGTAPAAVASLLATPPASAEERAAVDAVTPRLNPCLAAGVSANFNRPALRALLALAALRISAHNATAPPRR